MTDKNDDYNNDGQLPPPFNVSNTKKVIGETGGNYSMRNWKAYTPFLGMYKDISRRIPYFFSDWTDAWNYRVIPSTLLTFFANILPALAFAFELQEKTGGQYGVNEILISSFMAAAGFSLFGAQPLTIVGVTGPITVLNTSMYQIIQESDGPYPKPNYLEFVGWVYLISAITHILIAIFNLSNWLRHTTKYACQVFGFYVAWVYLLYGCQILSRQSGSAVTVDSLVLSAFLAVTFLTTSHVFLIASQSKYCHHLVRKFLSDYGMPITVVACSALPYWGRFNEIDVVKLPTVGGMNYTSSDRNGWIVTFWNCPAKWVAIAIPFSVLLTLLFYFDHQISAILGQGSDFPLKKPPGFHWDFALLGLVTFLAGLFGLPAPNGLIPQTPIHTQSLVVTEPKKVSDEGKKDSEKHERVVQVPSGVVEQRVTNLAQGGLALAFTTGPFLVAVGLVPTGVLAGLFWSLGLEALYGNMITKQISFLFKDRTCTSPKDPYRKVRKSRLLIFLAFELIGFGATYAVTNTRGAIGFPVIIILLIPFRAYLVPRMKIFTEEEINILDGPAANDFTMAGLTL